MDLIQALDTLTDIVDKLAELAKEQAHIIEQNRLLDEQATRENRERLSAIDERLMSLGNRAWRRKEERG